MKRIQILICALTMLLILSSFSSAQALPLTYGLGDQIQDFAFTTYDGQEIVFSEVLQEKDAVLINIWASWCSPCRSEFPYMQQAYEKYKDKVEVIALSSEASDTSSVLSSFAEQYGLSFLIGQDPVGFLNALQINSIPVTMMIDRFGTICMIQTGAQTNAESFECMFDAFIGDDYTESVLYRGIPAAKPDVSFAQEEELQSALEIEAFNPEGKNVWPMLPAEKDGRSVLESSNTGKASSQSSVLATVHAEAGDAIVVTFKTATEQIFDLFSISVNGEVIKTFSGYHDWMDYAIPVETSGEYTIKLTYAKDHQGNAEEDGVWIDRISIADHSVKALEANPFYPPAFEQPSISVDAPEAREIIIEDSYGLLKSSFGEETRYFIVNSNHAVVTGQLGMQHDAESAFFYTSHGTLTPLANCIEADGYRIEVDVDSVHTTQYACTSVLLYTDSISGEYLTALLFKDEENVNLLCEYNHLGEWHYVENTQEIGELPDQAEYLINCVDQHGQPVGGVMIQVCDETTCQVLFTDKNGQMVYTAPPYAWEFHILMTPEGYVADEPSVVIAPVTGGTIDFKLIKQ